MQPSLLFDRKQFRHADAEFLGHLLPRLLDAPARVLFFHELEKDLFLFLSGKCLTHHDTMT